MTITISHPTKDQFERILTDLLSIYQNAYEDLTEYAYHTAQEVGEYLEWLYEGDPRGFFVVYDDSQPVAFEAVHGSWRDKEGNVGAEIHELVVRKDYQGKGIGGKLLRLALDYARSLGRERVSLWVGENNKRAAEIYRKMGFVDATKWGIWQRMVLMLPKVDEGGEDTGEDL